jgi:hypothetical protein
MRSRMLACSFACGLLALGCRSTDQDSRPLPAPEPPASSVSPVREEAGPKRRVPEDEARPKRSAPEADATAKPGETASPASASSVSTPPSVAVPPEPEPATAPSACLSGCQSAMQSCLSAPVDGGVPGFGNLELCKKALSACQQACDKQQ